MAQIVVALLLCVLAANTTFAARRFNSIRDVDFRNLTFVGTSGFVAQSGGYLSLGFRLKNGTYGTWRDGLSFHHITYGDLTGDGKEEAIVILEVDNEGSEGVCQVYIFTLYKGRPIAFWGFQAGDRGDGGLRQIFTKNGKLVIDLFGKGTTLKNIHANTEFTGLATPKFFTRSVYVWSGKEFNQFGKEESFANPSAASRCPSCLVTEHQKHKQSPSR